MRHPSYREFLESLGASWIEVFDKEVVRDFGSADVEREQFLKLAVADRSERETIVCLGEDVIPLMQGLVTNNVFHLATPGSGQRNLAVSINGRTVLDARLLHVNEVVLMDLEPGTVADGRLGHFKKNVINEDAKFVDRSNGLGKLAVFGERAVSVLTTVATWDRNPADLSIFCGTAGRSNDGSELVLQRIDFGEIPAFEISLVSDEVRTLFAAILERNATPVGEDAQEFHRVSQHVPRFAVDRARTLYGAELADDIIPLEAELDSLIDFNKGCYLGQEIIARLDSRGVPAKSLRWFHATTDSDQVSVDGKNAGKIVTVVPDGDGFLCAAFVKRDFNERGNTVFVGEDAVVLS